VQPVTLFGLRVTSDLPLPGRPTNGVPDVRVTVARSRDVGPDGWRYDPPNATYGYGSARLTIAPDALHCALRPDTDPTIAALLILGPGLAGVLSHRAPVLHGTTVRPAGASTDTLVFGPSGVGKSTLSAAFIRAGARLVADDLAVLDAGPEGPTVRPGPSQLKLWADAADALGFDCAGLKRVHPDHAKFRVPVPGVAEPRPLGQLVQVLRGPELRVERVPPAEARLLVLANHRLPQILAPEAQPRWLHAAHRLARDVPMCRVHLPGPHDRLDDAIAAIAAHTG
jgi:hypothetical protein